MSDGPYWIQEIEKLSLGHTVLLVEGNDDVLLFEHFLNQHEPGWDTRLYIASAGGKQHVIAGIKDHRPHWIGIVDSDEWSPEKISEKLAGLPRLHLLPRFCIESYFCHPTEIWAALPESQKQQLDPQVLSRPILQALPSWVAHGAMWRVFRRFYEATRLPEGLESAPVTDEAEIRRILQTWHDQIAPDNLLEEYHQELGRAPHSTDEQLTQYIHGKRFYIQVVVQILDHLFAGKGARDWLQRFRDAPIQPPEDLKVLLDWILSFL